MRLARFGLALAALLSLLALPANAQVASGSVRTADPSYVNGETRPLSLLPSGALRVHDGSSGAAAQEVQGSTANFTVPTSNPFGMACVYTAGVPPIVTDNTLGRCQATQRGSIRVTLMDTGATAVGISNAGSDTVTGAATNGVNVTGFNFVFDGTQYVRQRGDVGGGTVVQPGLVATHWTYAAASGGISNTTTAVTIKTAAGAGVRNCIAALQLFNGTLGAATEVAIRDGAAGTVIWRGRRETVASSEDVVLPVPICGTANTLLEVVTLTATVTGGVYVNAQGFTRP